jgi:hypothetical protein
LEGSHFLAPLRHRAAELLFRKFDYDESGGLGIEEFNDILAEAAARGKSSLLSSVPGSSPTVGEWASFPEIDVLLAHKGSI